MLGSSDKSDSLKSTSSVDSSTNCKQLVSLRSCVYLHTETHLLAAVYTKAVDTR